MRTTPKPIRTNEEHAEAVLEIERLAEKDPQPGTAAFDRLEVLGILVDAFESSHPDHRIDDVVDPVEAIKFHLERHGKKATAKELAAVLGCTRTRAWEILNHARALTLPQIRLLHSELGIPADRLIAEYDLQPRTESVKAARVAAQELARKDRSRSTPLYRPATT